MRKIIIVSLILLNMIHNSNIQADQYKSTADYLCSDVDMQIECTLQVGLQGENKIIVKSDEFEAFVKAFVYDKEHNQSEELLMFCEKILKGEGEFSSEEIQRVLPELISFALTEIEQTKAPRPDAPGNTDGAPVGTLLECDFSQILQLLNRLTQIINQCCAQLQLDFQFTWTILADIKSTITNDFNGTFTILNDIESTLTTCCAVIQNDFIGVFTSIAAIDMDFNGIFTSLVDIKSTITNDFNGTFTVLNDIESTLTTCCATIQNDFIGVFTSIATINMDFNGVFTVLTDINDTLTACCANIQTDFNGVFTVLSEINITLTTDFEGTFTAIAGLKSPCDATPITTATIITVPGFYCLANDIVNTLSIVADDVTVDLNNHTVSAVGGPGIFISAVSNVIVKNGKINDTDIGVHVSNDTNEIELSNLLITNCSDTGIVLDDGCVANNIHDITINSVGNIGINFVNNNNDSQCRRVTLSNFDLTNLGLGVGIGTSQSISNSIFEDCRISDANSLVLTFPFSISSGNNNQIIRCAVLNIAGGTDQTVGGMSAFLIGSNNTTVDNCTTLSIFSAFAVGFNIEGTNISVSNCSVISAESFASIGFNIIGGSVTCSNCLAEAIGGGIGSFGFVLGAPDVNFINCQAYSAASAGFSITSTGLLLNCESAYNGIDGFTIEPSGVTTVVGNCVAFLNSGIGFNAVIAGTSMYGCFASRNGTNYSAASPNVQAASTAVGVFARGNNFI